jgi:glyceraldehyde 3-phosphate dehydrogenase
MTAKRTDGGAKGRAPVRIGINGFGRIGRTVFRIVHERPDVEVVVVNDLYENDQLAYLLKHDTVMGVFPGEVGFDHDYLYADGKQVLMTAEKDPAAIPWGKHGVDFVIESTGVWSRRAELEKHLAGGAKKVILTVPARDEIDAMIVIGVNEDVLEPEHRLVSNASCTTNCLAPVAKILDDAFGIESGLMTTVHAYTNDQRLADVPHKDLRRSRAAAENIIPTTTGAAKAVGKVLPALAGKLDGLAIRVPVPDGSVVDLVCRLRKSATRDQINDAVRAAAATPRLDRIVEYSEEALVSTDIVGNSHSSIFDALSTDAADGWAKVIAWYDNEWGYSNRVVDLLMLPAFQEVSQRRVSRDLATV